MANKKNIIEEEEKDDFMDLPPAPKFEAVDVYSSAGSLIRTYTEAEQGKDFLHLAEGYASKVGGTTKAH